MNVTHTGRVVAHVVGAKMSVGDLVSDLRLDSQLSQAALARRSVAFLLHSPDFRSHFRVRKVTSSDQQVAAAPAEEGAAVASPVVGVRYELLLVRRLDRESQRLAPSMEPGVFLFEVI